VSSNPRLDRGEPLHRQLARNIRNDIHAGVFRHGDVLPTTRELSAQWDVSVFTVTEAMKVLMEEGLVISKSRSKRVINCPDEKRAEVRLRRPQVLIIGGYAGSGKSELGRMLARGTGWPLLDKDTITRPVVEGALELLGQSPHDRESDTYLNKVRPREYEALAAVIVENVECGNSAIVTAPFIREFREEPWLNRTQATYYAMDASVTFIWVYCNAETMHAYIRHRGAARDAAKLADWHGYLASIDIGFRPPVPHIVVDNSANSRPLQEQAQDILKTVIAGASGR